jgi:hypothetical protein
MGTSAIVIGAVALATGLICLFFGYMWGRSNVKSQVEGALNQTRISADAREFALREQLDEMMVEVAKFRARAEESPRLQEPPAQSKSKQVHGSAGGDVAAEEPGNTMPATQKLPWQKRETTAPIESTDKTIQNLLKSIEEKSKQPEAEPRAVTQQNTPPPPGPTPPRPALTKLPAEEPRVVAQKITPPLPQTINLPAEEPRVVTQKITPPPATTTKLPAEKPPAVTRPSPRPPTKSPAAGTPSAAKDEWQEFAASLEALTRRKK